MSVTLTPNCTTPVGSNPFDSVTIRSGFCNGVKGSPPDRSIVCQADPAFTSMNNCIHVHDTSFGLPYSDNVFETILEEKRTCTPVTNSEPCCVSDPIHVNSAVFTHAKASQVTSSENARAAHCLDPLPGLETCDPNYMCGRESSSPIGSVVGSRVTNPDHGARARLVYTTKNGNECSCVGPTIVLSDLPETYEIHVPTTNINTYTFDCHADEMEVCKLTEPSCEITIGVKCPTAHPSVTIKPDPIHETPGLTHDTTIRDPCSDSRATLAVDPAALCIFTPLPIGQFAHSEGSVIAVQPANASTHVDQHLLPSHGSNVVVTPVPKLPVTRINGETDKRVQICLEEPVHGRPCSVEASVTIIPENCSPGRSHSLNDDFGNHDFSLYAHDNEEQSTLTICDGSADSDWVDVCHNISAVSDLSFFVT
ncbi:hypothetical protein BaRGS_00009506 [Batillaria attramentaria]|uniref:Uncharacterized protein n=1 Tax=Batillaria attramentaria TaxID=370345 RepID=A0ABD0LJ84_9CAEN